MNMRMLRHIGLAFLLVSLLPAQARHPASPQDVYRLVGVSAPALSPDGRTVAYVVTRAEAVPSRRVRAIWLVAAGGGTPARELIGDVSASAPRWSPDGRRLAFLSNGRPVGQTKGAAPKTQVWLEAADGVGRRQVTHLPDGVSDFRWSPDGRSLAVVSSNAPARPGDFRDYTSMFYKFDGRGWLDGQNHIWVVDVAGGQARALTSGHRHTDSDPEWSPDGASIAYATMSVGPDLRHVGGQAELRVIPAAGGAPRTLVGPHANLSQPRWSPDGKRIAYAASPVPAYQPRLYTIAAGGGAPRLATQLDLFPTSIGWDRAGGLWFNAHDRGTEPYFRINPAQDATTEVLRGDRAYHDLQVSRDGSRLVYLLDDTTHPPALYASAADGAHPRLLADPNRALLAQLELAPAQRVEWKSSAGGLPIEGFLTKPIGWRPGRKYPMILEIHGGPNGMFGFHFRLDEQLYAGEGYAVFRTNPRGSSGYGMAFQRAVAMQWGGNAYDDIVSGVEAVLARNPWIDPNRLGVVGHSYGGFMTDWIVGHTKMFRAAISIAGISDFISDEGVRDAAFGHSRDFGGDLFSQFSRYWNTSPLQYAAGVKTPTLFLDGDADWRVPLSQAEEYFRAIKHFGGTAELVIFPGESHMLPDSARPRHLVETYEWRVYWFNRYVKGEAGLARPNPYPAGARQ